MTDDGQSSQLAALEKLLLDESADPVDLPFSLLKAITGNFSEDNKIGGGGFGAVYKGVLPSGRTIAVKKLFERFEILDKNFESEIACLVGVKHKNTVRFLGYCSETQHVMRLYEGRLVWADVRQRLLCFEYLPKGCLAKYRSDASCRLQWTICYQIIKGICEGVHYLHQQRIIHMDLKPQNVLLDDNMVPRIADFGLSRRLSGSQSRAITDDKHGTMGYMAPEFLNSREITFKTDIYSLGVIIMEILMGHKECSSVKEVVESWADMFGTLNSHTSLEQVKACAEIGIACTNYYPVNRPATWFIIRGILGDAEISNWPVTSYVGTSTEGQILDTWRNRLQISDGDIEKLEQIRVCAELGIQCAQLNPVQRPVTQHIIDRLAEVKDRSIKTGTFAVEQVSAQFGNSSAPAAIASSTASEHDEVTELLQKLSSQKALDQREAAGALRQLAKLSAKHRARIGESGGIPVLTRLLSSTTDLSTMEHVVTTLLIISVNRENRRRIVSSGGVAGIMRALESGNMSPLALLSILSNGPEGVAAISAAAAVTPSLVGVIRNGSPGSKANAVAILLRLCDGEGEQQRQNLAQAHEHGLKPLLAELKKSSSTHREKSKATRLLRLMNN